MIEENFSRHTTQARRFKKTASTMTLLSFALLKAGTPSIRELADYLPWYSTAMTD
jgi:hypothetical protein